jgi:octaheme c-type cytochrome (tetrathionate reductase family)
MEGVMAARKLGSALALIGFGMVATTGTLATTAWGQQAPPPPPISAPPVQALPVAAPAPAPAPAAAAQPAPVAAAAPASAAYTPRASKKTADHSKFEVLNGPFKSGPEVTKACLTCHTEASKQIHKSIHWTWTKEIPATGQVLGKKTVVNSFCGNIATNEPRCTSCHAGYGWKDATFDFTSEVNVDCLVCHESTGTYVKAPAGAGNPPAQPIKFGGKDLLPPDWSKVAKSVSSPTRENCGACHFYGGGGDAVKHGDMDSTLTNPTRKTDVHMDAKGLNFQCSTCHVENQHQFPGSRYTPAAKDMAPASHRGAERNVATCEACHSQQPHKGATLRAVRLNTHTDKLACQTCHIPEMARGGKATKTFWDWSTAGKMKDGKPYFEKGPHGEDSYATIKGSFVWEKNVVPTYAWFDGQVRYSLVGDNINPDARVPVNSIRGAADDPNSRIWPFKAMLGRQAYDKVRNTLIYKNLFGQNDSAFWVNFDWGKAIAAGMKAGGFPYSGEFGFVDTIMYWPLNHMIAPKEDAVKCGQCHAREGRLANVAGFYMPGRDGWRWLDILGWLAVAGTLAGVIIHALLRAMAARKTQAAQ